MIFAFALFSLAMFAVALLMTPKPAKPDAGKIEAQGADEGKAIPVNFGTNDIAMNIVWNGESRTKPYKKSGGKK